MSVGSVSPALVQLGCRPHRGLSQALPSAIQNPLGSAQQGHIFHPHTETHDCVTRRSVESLLSNLPS